jgi:hypothetical protein
LSGIRWVSARQRYNRISANAPIHPDLFQGYSEIPDDVKFSRIAGDFENDSSPIVLSILLAAGWRE